uniref:myelin-oligodendrocyte glycoprotein-like isoform X1 n=1 Tax=Scatophagus argus TaxID=75038 RepID=UPI001ED829E8|nr:myelin-oligodendrocyte glycoprotein-like isoform X1 [Scatophagus argus]
MFLLLFLLFVLSEAASDSSVEPDVVVQVRPGDDVTLPCQTAEASIRAVRWTRDDLKTSEYVLLYRDGRSDPTHQHPSYQGRVELVDSQLKPGDVSLILKNVSSSDPGTYECRVVSGGSGRQKRALIDTEPIRVISLEVTGSDSQKGDNMHGDQTSDSPEDGNQSPGHAGLAAGVLLLLAVGAVGVVMFLRTRRRREAVRTSETPDADEAAVVVLP